VAIAEGKSIIAWAQENEVPERTAFRWVRDLNVHREAEATRHRAMGLWQDIATGRLRFAEPPYETGNCVEVAAEFFRELFWLLRHRTAIP
jgi:hypothetical protein